MRTRQRGAGGFFIAVLLLAVIGGIVATIAYLQSRGQAGRGTQEQQRFEGTKSALQQFVALNKRLPCPADPATDAGTEAGSVTAGTCTYPMGTVPWATLGLRRDDAIDNWGSKISYRVYTGPSGSLTQTDGLNMYNCDTAEPAGWAGGRTPITGSAGGLCRATKNTLDTEFLSGKGLSITTYGAAATDAAYVLISHGPSGGGAFTAVSPYTQRALPTNASELANLNAAGPFVATNHSAASVGPADAAHFDDFLAYERIGNLVRLAGLAARDWDDTSADATLNSTTIAAAVGSAPAPGTDLGLTTLTFESARVTGLGSSGATTQNLTLNASGDGLGTAGGSLDISSSTSDGVRIDLKSSFRKFAFTLVDFGTSGGLKETVLVNFYAGSTQVSTATRHGCNADGSSVLASFEFDLGVTDFDRVEIFPQAMVNPAGIPTGNPSAFFLSAFRACASGACATSLETVGNLCTT